jgi:anti-anti-sigma regulatory factor
VNETFRVAVEADAGPVRMVLAGDVDVAALPALRAALRSLFERRPERIEIDLGDVELVETVTAAFLAREQAAARALGTRVVLMRAQGVPSRLLAMAGAELETGPEGDALSAPSSPGPSSPALR